MKIEIIKISPVRWEEYKKLRLEALREEPGVFGLSAWEISGSLEGFWKKDLENVLFVQIGGELCGMGKIKPARVKTFSHIVRFSEIYIDPQYRGMGIGEKLLRAMISEAFSTSEIQKIKLSVNCSKKPAIALYQKCGFKVVGKMEKEFKVGRAFYDAYLLELLKDN